MMESNSNAIRPALIVHSGPYRCALPLACVAETMRVLPIRSFANMPAFVCGASVIRGEPVVVVDLARFLGAAGAAIGRLVVIRVDQRRVALAVESVVGVAAVDEARLASVPPLLQAVHPEFVRALGAADERLLVVLGSAKILPEEVWEALGKEET